MTTKSATLYQNLENNISRVLFGKQKTIRLMLCSLLAGGHILLEDVPGTGKTSMVRALAASIDAQDKRVQFTPDLLPSDITGINFYRQQTGDFVLRRGPIFTNLFLADEINRATPRTQAALLECMEERQATIDGDILPLPEVFMVLATMNPIEFQGTFPLPEAQVDRFMMKLHPGYPDEADEKRIVEQTCQGSALAALTPVAIPEDVIAAREEIAHVQVSEAIRDYIVRIVRATRESDKVKLGVSPRGTVALTRASRALAAMMGRDFVIPDDVNELAVPVLSHRIMSQSQSSIHLSGSNEAIIEYLLSKIPAPLQ